MATHAERAVVAPAGGTAVPGASHLAAAPGGLDAAGKELLPAEDAFRFSARALDDHTLEASFDVADGYYLYRDKLAFAVEPAAGLATPALPPGVRKHDAFFGDVDTYRGRVVVRLPLAQAQPGRVVTLKADSQGCADAGLCYPPSVQQVRVVMPVTGAGPGPVVQAKRKGWFH